MLPAAETAPDVSQAVLAVARVGGRSVVVGARATHPLRLLAPANHGDAAWVFQSSHGGGFVGDDDVRLSVSVDEGASLYLSSQASSKVYRAAHARFTLDATLAAGATLVSWPDPVVCFAGASLAQTQRFTLAGATTSLLAVDAWTAGRVARGERWAFDRLATRLTIDVAGERRFHDAQQLTSEHGPLAARLAGVDAFATIVLAGPRFRGACADVPPLGVPLVTRSAWPWGTVLRVAAPSAEALALTVRALLQPVVRAVLGDDPCVRKW